MKFVRGFGRGFQTNRAEGVQMGEGGRGFHTQTKPTKRGGGPKSNKAPAPKQLLTLFLVLITGSYNAPQRTQRCANEKNSNDETTKKLKHAYTDCKLNCN